MECLGLSFGLTDGTTFADSSRFWHMWSALGLHVAPNLLTVLGFLYMWSALALALGLVSFFSGLATALALGPCPQGHNLGLWP